MENNPPPDPFFHRIDPNGLQLPYIDEVIIHIASAGLIAAKTGAGESDLQGRHLTLEDYTFLKEGEARGDYQVRLWQNGYGSQYALYPRFLRPPGLLCCSASTLSFNCRLM